MNENEKERGNVQKNDAGKVRTWQQADRAIPWYKKMLGKNIGDHSKI